MKQGYIPDDLQPWQQTAKPQPAQPRQKVQQGMPPAQPYFTQPVQQAAFRPSVSQGRAVPRKRHLLLLIAGLLGLAYFVYILVYFVDASNSAVNEIGEGFGQLASALMMRLVMPHIIMAGVSALANLLAWWINNKWLALAAAAGYLIAALMFTMYWLFVVPSFILAVLAVYLMFRREQVVL